MDLITEARFAELPLEGWTEITFVQTYEQSCQTYEDGQEPRGFSVFEWETHRALCPDCRREQADAGQPHS